MTKILIGISFVFLGFTAGMTMYPYIGDYSSLINIFISGVGGYLVAKGIGDA